MAMLTITAVARRPPARAAAAAIQQEAAGSQWSDDATPLVAECRIRDGY